MKIVLNRDDIEEAIRAHVQEKYFKYEKKQDLVIVQGTKASAVITLKQVEQLPGLADRIAKQIDPDDLPVGEEDDAMAIQADTGISTSEGPFPGMLAP